jgi:hypothetical protein
LEEGSIFKVFTGGKKRIIEMLDAIGLKKLQSRGCGKGHLQGFLSKVVKCLKIV